MMDTPIYDFIEAYRGSAPVRLHMPGHKGRLFLGCEDRDITEVPGADALYEAGGIIARSEKNAAALFGAGRTVFSTEGSSQCIRAMVYLAVSREKSGRRPYLLAARNAHKAFLYALALCDADVRWLYPAASGSLCSCPVTAEEVEAALNAAEYPPAAVYLTSPDYLGWENPIEDIARVCHKYGVPLLVDNAHGAYLHFLPEKRHPMDLGADLCCDSAHKTLPVLTGGAYLHVGKDAPRDLADRAKQAMALFGSTSPSYLILASLDLCNRYLDQGYAARLRDTAALADRTKARLVENGWSLFPAEPLKITILATRRRSGEDLAALLRKSSIQCEYADREHLVLMVSTETTQADLDALMDALGKNTDAPAEGLPLPRLGGEAVLTPREAVFAPQKRLPVEEALGRICAAPTVGCPPAIPIAVSGERIGEGEIALFRRYGIDTVAVVEE